MLMDQVIRQTVRSGRAARGCRSESFQYALQVLLELERLIADLDERRGSMDVIHCLALRLCPIPHCLCICLWSYAE